MNDWRTEAQRLAQQRAPALTDDHVRELVDDLFRARHEEGWTPAKAVEWFFAFMPLDWEPRKPNPAISQLLPNRN